MVDRSAIGRSFGPVTAHVEPGRLRFFLDTIGETNSAFRQPAGEAAPIPPTYLFCLEMMDAENPFAFLEELGIELGRVLHGDQSFVYHARVRVGDRLTYRSKVEDVFDKKGGALTFIVQSTEVENQHGALVVTMRRTIVVRNPQAAQ